jgi:hypothetical protein
VTTVKEDLSTQLIKIDCSEMSTEEQLALASEISDSLSGRALALVNGRFIELDVMSAPGPDIASVEALVLKFVSSKKDARYYSVERDGDRLLVRTPDPIAGKRGQKPPGLPDNLMKCPFCGFVTPYQEMYTVHVRAHGFT